MGRSFQFVRQRISGFPIVILLLVWLASLGFGWSMEALIGSYLSASEGRYYWEQFPLLFQSGLSAMVGALIFFHYCILFSNLTSFQKFGFFLTAYLGSVGCILLSTGFLSDQQYLVVCGHWEYSTPGPWLPIKSYFGWSLVVNFLIGNAISTWILSYIFRSEIIDVTTRRGGEQEQILPGINSSVMKKALGLLGFVLLGVFIAIVRQGLIDEFDSDLVFAYGIGLASGVGPFVLAALFSSIRSKILAKALLITLWGLLGFVFYSSIFNLQWDDTWRQWLNWSYAPGVLTFVFIALSFLSTIFVFGGVAKTLNVKAKPESHSNQLDVDADPFDQSIRTEETPKTGNVPSESEQHVLLKRPVIGTGKVAWVGVLLAFVLFIGYQVPRVVSPYVLANTWNYDLAKIVAMNRVANEGKHYCITRDDGKKYREKARLMPLLVHHLYDGDTAFSKGFRLTLNIQPVCTIGRSEAEGVLELKRNKRELDFISYAYYENGPNGEIYDLLLKILNGCPALNAKDLSEEQLYDLLEGTSYVIPRYRNCLMKGRFFDEYRFSSVPFEFIDCTFEPEFRFKNFLSTSSSIFVDNPSGMTVIHWLELEGHSSVVRVVVREMIPSSCVFLCKSEGRRKHTLSKRTPKDVLVWRSPARVNEPFFLPCDLMLKKEEELGNHLKSTQFFNAEDFPEQRINEINFRSKDFEVDSGRVKGLLVDRAAFSPFIVSMWKDDVVWLDYSNVSVITSVYDPKLKNTYPKLKYLKLSKWSFSFLHFFWRKEKVLTPSRKVPSLLLSPNLKTLQVEVSSVKQRELLTQSNVETLIVSCQTPFKLRGFLRFIDRLPKLKRVLVLSYPKKDRPSFDQSDAAEFAEDFKIANKKIPVYLLSDPKQEVDFRSSWEDLSKDNYWLLCNPKSQSIKKIE